jgi:hypothetical protein
MNWDALGKAIGWLPGAGVGSFAGAVAGAVSFDSLASRCSLGDPFVGIGGVVTQSTYECVRSPVGDLGMLGYLGMMAFIGAVVGVIVQRVVDRARGQQA